MNDELWTELRGWTELRESGQETLSADKAGRARVARLLGLESLKDLRASLDFEPWLDGARISGRVEADAIRLCGITLESLDEHVETSFAVRVVPEGSPHAPKPETELVVTFESDDPPDVADRKGVDVAAYIVEALGLALDPFPRKAGEVFDYVDLSPEPSPFAILLRKNDQG